MHRIPIRVLDDDSQKYVYVTKEVIAHQIEDTDLDWLPWKRYMDHSEENRGMDVKRLVERLTPMQRMQLEEAFGLTGSGDQNSALPRRGLLGFLLSKLSDLKDWIPDPLIWSRKRRK